jgi:hypothetical protein
MNPLSGLLGTVLLLAATTKLRHGFGRGAAPSTALGRFLPEQGTVGVWRLLSLAEAAVGICLLTFPASRLPALAAGTMFLAAGAYALLALKKAPERPCGCFGISTGERTTIRTPARALLLTAMAATAAAVGDRWTDVAPLGWWLVAAGAAAIVVVVVSPDIRGAGAGLVRRRTPACLTSYVPLETCRVLLAGSEVWKRLHPLVEGAEPTDHWRDGCWSFLSFRVAAREGDATAVFALRGPPGPRHVRAVVVDEKTGRLIAEDYETGRRRRWLQARHNSNEQAVA